MRQDRLFTGPALGFCIAALVVAVVRLIVLGRYLGYAEAAGPQPLDDWTDSVAPLGQVESVFSVIGFVFLLLADLVVGLWLALLNRLADAQERVRPLRGTATRIAWWSGLGLTLVLLAARFVVTEPASSAPGDRIRYAATALWLAGGVLVAVAVTGWTTVAVRRRSRAVLAP